MALNKKNLKFNEINVATNPDKRNEMLKTLDDSIKDNPEQLERIKHIVNDWADMKIKSFRDRRSWVRNTDDD